MSSMALIARIKGDLDDAMYQSNLDPKLSVIQSDLRSAMEKILAIRCEDEKIRREVCQHIFTVDWIEVKAKIRHAGVVISGDASAGIVLPRSTFTTFASTDNLFGSAENYTITITAENVIVCFSGTNSVDFMELNGDVKMKVLRAVEEVSTKLKNEVTALNRKDWWLDGKWRTIDFATLNDEKTKEFVAYIYGACESTSIPWRWSGGKTGIAARYGKQTIGYEGFEREFFELLQKSGNSAIRSVHRDNRSGVNWGLDGFRKMAVNHTCTVRLWYIANDEVAQWLRDHYAEIVKIAKKYRPERPQRIVTAIEPRRNEKDPYNGKKTFAIVQFLNDATTWKTVTARYAKIINESYLF